MQVKNKILIAAAVLLVIFCGWLGTFASNSLLSARPIVSGVDLYTVPSVKKLSGKDPANAVLTIQGHEGVTASATGKDLLENPVDAKLYGQVVLSTLKQAPGEKILFPVNPGEFIYKEGALEKTAALLDSQVQANHKPVRDATIAYTDNGFVIVPEQQGSNINQAALVQVIQKSFRNLDMTIDLDAEQLYTQPQVKATDTVLKKSLTAMTNALNASVDYVYGWNDTVLTADSFASWLEPDGKGGAKVNDTKLKTWLTGMQEDNPIYTSKEEALKYKQTLTGYILNVDEEAQAAQTAIASGTKVERELPEFEITSDDIAAIVTEENKAKLASVKSRLGSDFVYIDIEQQFMWYYKNGQMLVATPVTTGTEYAYDTPKGLYSLYYKAQNVTLKGDNGDGTKYESKVVYWMPFNGDIGIHDADNWRSQYGGDIYEYNGSHGCVNTPREKAALIYENIEADTPILVE